MALLPYAANLNSAFYPFLSRWNGRTVIVEGKDEFYKPKLTTNEPSNPANEGIAQVFYSENVMPAANGIQSIGFLEQLEGIPGSVSFDDYFLLRDIDENKYLFSPANGNNYIYNANFGGWVAVGGPVAPLTTVAYINGHTYIYFSNVGCYEYNPTTNVLDAVVLVGVVAADLEGICASNGYLIAWDHFSVYRSQPLSILDFTPNPAQGSGGSIPEGIAGQIVACLPIFGGFLIYTTKNIVAASYTQNVRYPFVYKEIPGGAGIQRPNQVSWQENIGSHYAWTQAGLLNVTKSSANSVFNPVTDFLTCGVLETFNAVTNLLEEVELVAPLNVKVAVLGQTWLVISYGISSYTHALVYDLNYKRWGKVKITHACAAELILPNLSGAIGWDQLDVFSWTDLGSSSWSNLGTQLITFEAPNTILAFMAEDGTVYSVDFRIIGADHAGVLFLGKYQYVRNRWLSMQELSVECVKLTSNFQTFLIPTYDGKTLEAPTELVDTNNNGLVKIYGSDIQGHNLSILEKGTFQISSITMDFKLEGAM